MITLGIESSCDETAAAIVRDGQHLLSHVVHTQIDIHKAFGGVVPEVAARSHIEVILPVVDHALTQANVDWQDIDAIGVTYAPGLIGSLLIGTLAARTIAIVKNKPLYAIHHVEAHVYANFITDYGSAISQLAPSKKPVFPLLALIVSGNHSQLVLFTDHGQYRLLGQTQDDAVGEAFDKVAKILGLPYPGGPAIAAAALNGNPTAYKFPDAKLANPYDSSFSGLKTAVLRHIQRLCNKPIDFPSASLAPLLTSQQIADTAASFQHTAIQTLVGKTVAAYAQYRPASVVIAGGVASSQELRRQLRDRLPAPIEYVAPSLCTDNGAMVAALTYFTAQRQAAPCDPYTLEVMPSLSM